MAFTESKAYLRGCSSGCIAHSYIFIEVEDSFFEKKKIIINFYM